MTASAFTFRLVSTRGDTLGSIRSHRARWYPGDELHANGVGYRVTAVIPVERIAEFIDGPANGLLQVEPLQL